MKAIEFETSRGMFGLVDNPILPQAMSVTTKYIKLSEITEEQASEIVFRIGHHSNGHLIPSAVELLHSLIKSKGIHLFENPFGSEQAALRAGYYEQWIKDNQKTFYNPYVLKL